MNRQFEGPLGEVTAVQFANANFDEVEAFVGGDAEFRGGRLLVATTKGPLWANPQDWIVKGVRGDFFTASPSMFAEVYRPVPEGRR